METSLVGLQQNNLILMVIKVNGKKMKEHFYFVLT